jgi:sigma-54-specific transcriptional regulator
VPTVLTLTSAFPGRPIGRAKALVFEDPRSRALLEHIQRLARGGASILIEGETGTGKEIVARHIHALSPRAAQPFVAVNCGAFSESLIESDLFGHQRGAFTGATADKAGWFECADGGTLFLDEIGDLSPRLQVKLLRVLQEQEVVRLGSHRSIPVNVRIVAATNVGIDRAIAAGTFRLDLFYRIAVARVVLDPLRERPGDILPLARHFLGVYGADDEAQTGRWPAEDLLTPAVAGALLAHSWPGNIRELENAIQHALLVRRTAALLPEDLGLSRMFPLAPAGGAALAEEPSTPRPIGAAVPRDARQMVRDGLRGLCHDAPDRLWDEVEELVIRSAFEHAGGNQLKMARTLGLGRSVVRARLIRFGLLAAPANAGDG